MAVRFKVVFLAIIILSAVSCVSKKKDNQDSAPIADSIISSKKPAPNLLYGIPADSFDIENGHIKKNEFLSEILLRHGVPGKDLDFVIKKYKDVLDVRDIRAGANYSLFCQKDSTARARYLVYEHSQSTCFIFSFCDSLSITPFHKGIESVIKYSSGTIVTSMWDAMISGGMHPSLAVELSDIFAWTVDFFGLQKGDRFKVIYEEQFIDGKSIGTERVYGAEFTRSGVTVTAIPFIQNDKESYYDCDGNSLRKAFLKAPLQFARISSRFSSGRMHPILRIVRAHYGVDYAAPLGTPVVTIGDGTVTSVSTDAANGNIVRIQHNSIYSTAYLHLSRFGPGIKNGVSVKQGDVIGYVGSSGLSTGPHLDFRFFKSGYAVDPLRVEAPAVEPVLEENKTRFEINKTVVVNLLSTFN
jgi:murein DD-endopeptidase MepM/ murein hydrolase activator NlpD